MKPLLLASILAALLSTASATIIYSGTQNLPVAWDDLDGLYVNIATGQIATDYPGDFDDSAWINFSLGGTGIFNGDLLRPWASVSGAYDPDLTTDYYVNLAPGTVIDGASAFFSTGWGSQYHTDSSGVPQFAIGEQGYLGFVYQTTEGGDNHYGWFRLTVDNTGNGIVHDWAYTDAPNQGIQAGAIPEPSTYALVAGLLMLGLVALRRRSAA